MVNFNWKTTMPASRLCTLEDSWLYTFYKGDICSPQLLYLAMFLVIIQMPPPERPDVMILLSYRIPLAHRPIHNLLSHNES